MQHGDAAKEIAAAEHRLAGRIRIGGQEHFYLEGQAALAVPGEDDDVTIYTSTQHPSEIQHKVAQVLGVANHCVTAEVRRMGGAFGGKESHGNLPACASALVAKLTGRPAKCVYDRDDDMMITGKRHDFRIDYRVGFDAKGRIKGIEFDQALRCGMSWDLSEPIADRAMFHADNAYYFPAARITSYRCKTNTQSNTAFRGFGGPQGMIAIEHVIEQIAAHLRLDPLDVRRVNFYAHRDDTGGSRRLTPYGMEVEDCIIKDLFDELVDSSDYLQRRDKIRQWNRQSPTLKRGIAITPVKFGISFTKTFLNQAGALVHVYNDGSIHLNHGGTEMGQGLFTKVAQVVAEEFQVDIERIKITATTTAKVPNTSATAASSGSDLNGMAAFQCRALPVPLPHLRLDPLDVRRVNFYAHRDDTGGSRRLTPYGMEVEDCIIKDLFDELVDSSDYLQRRDKIRQWNRQSPTLKRGIAITPVKFGISFTKTFLNQAGALVHVYNDGSIHLNHGGTEMGQGLFTKVAQVVAEEFQVDIERIKITATTTAKVPNTSATAASSGSDLNGMAAKNAAAKIKQRLVTFLCQQYQTAETEIRFLPGRVRVGEQEISFNDVIGQAYFARVPLSATGFYATPKISWDKASASGRPFFYFSYGATVAEAIIDTLTGENRLTRVDILHDVGKSLNPALDLGQIEGGFVQGAGWLTTEELVWDDKGRLMTHAPSTYKIPACSDRAPDMRISLFERGENIEQTIYRSKAVGEPPLMLGISALMALGDAVASVNDYKCAVSLDAPATPERILDAVGKLAPRRFEREEAS